MRKFIFILGIFFSFFLIKYRESLGNSLGQMKWMSHVGGIYYVIVFIAIFIFFWSIAELTNTTNIFLYPILLLLPKFNPEVAPPPSEFTL